ncbi:S-layer homology domain-containing protein [Flavonifractor sp. An100]|uniref:S-layer homology domain-containing protein n=1 Tax=Flavonifractor sp. An100 TaxID=1965538 RepID=UPI001179CA3C|nr:S-layer homology domain-containing protein [Flavonifractor sp. An100]
MKTKRIIRRVASLALAVALTAGLCCAPASAYTYPSAYWALHSAWEEAVNAKSTSQVISVAQQTYDLLMKESICADICYNLEPKCARASWCAEIQGDLDGAITWLERQRTFASWLDQNVRDYSDALINIEARLKYLESARNVKVYAQQDQGGRSYSGSGAAVNGTYYGSAVTGSQSGESAVLMYVTFGDSYSVDYWLDYYSRTFPKFEQAINNGGVVEIAWNFSSESTAGAQQVLSSDSYISESLAAMGDLNATVLLRLGAEMNNWSNCDSATYIQAFQKVAAQAHKYPNIKMVFSPATVSNRNVTIDQFYPGDAYADWIGVSAYQTSNYAGEATSYSFDATNYGNDAYYYRGLYAADPMPTLADVAELAQKHNKPLMISECGFSYTGASGDQTAYAVDQMNKFYSYVNMVYPQVKAVFYFDNNISGSTYRYALAGNSSLQAAYTSAIEQNGSYLAWGEDSAPVWVPLEQVTGEQSGSLRLATYSVFPGKSATTVTYYVDGKAMYSSSKAPYYYDLNLANLSAGTHKVTVTASGGQFSETSQSYTITVPAGPQVPSSWAAALVSEAQDKNLVTQRVEDVYQDQITRLQFADLAVNLIEEVTGEEIVPADVSFTDTSEVVVAKAVAAGVTSGKGENTFAPNDKITRQEICVMLNKVIQYVDAARGTTTLDNTSTQMDAKFTDTASIASWAVDSVALLTNNGLMSGKDGGRVAPLDNTKVEEAIVLILALYKQF